MTQPQPGVAIESFKCADCGNVIAQAKKVCPKCGSIDMEVFQSQGKGEVIDFTVVYYPPDNYKDREPYTSILVRLKDGCKLFGVIDGEVKDIPEGSPVTLVKKDDATGGYVFRLG